MIQKTWRGYFCRKNYGAVSLGLVFEHSFSNNSVSNLKIFSNYSVGRSESDLLNGVDV